MSTVTATAPMFYPLQADSVEVENTTTATIFQDNQATAANIIQQIPADTWHRGDMYEYIAYTHVNDNNSTDTLALDFRMVDNASTPNSTDFLAVSAFDAADNDYHYVHGFFILKTAPGTAATAEYFGTVTGIEAGTALAVAARQFHGTATVDTTTAIDFVVEATWSVAHADNEVELRQLCLRKVGVGSKTPCQA